MKNSTYRIPINPVPASRPRVSKFGTYYGKKYTKFREEIKPILDEMDMTILSGPLVLSLTFNISKPKTSKLDYPSPDIDNFCKAIMDSLHGYLYEDDKQVIHLQASKQFVSGEGSIVVYINEVK